MILIDTSIWADHFDRTDDRLVDLGNAGYIRTHPYVIGELSAGNLRPWEKTVAALRVLPSTSVLSDDAFYAFILNRQLMGTGLSFVDIHILASAIDRKWQLWTRDKKLAIKAAELNCVYLP